MTKRMRGDERLTAQLKQAARRLNPLERMAAAGAECYRRDRDLPRVLPLLPDEIADESPETARRIIDELRRALSSERRRARAAHWTYDLNRHLALLSAYKGEMAMLSRTEAALKARPSQPQPRVGACGPGRDS